MQLLDCCRNKECSNYWTCCTEEDPCEEGEGDCDLNKHCADGLICGIANCIGPQHQINADCCEKAPTTTTTTTTTTTITTTTPTTTWPDGMFRFHYSNHIFPIG